MGIFDQFISARLLDRYPQLYQLGQKGQFVSWNLDDKKWSSVLIRCVVQNK